MEIQRTGQCTKKLLKLIWALCLNKIEAIKAIKMSFAGPAVFIAENIDAKELINLMNSNENGYKGYLKALDNLFVGKAKSGLSRTKFSSAIQERGCCNEYVTNSPPPLIIKPDFDSITALANSFEPETILA